MYVVSVIVLVKPEHVADFIDASLANARGSRTEPGNLRWDLSQCEDEPHRFLLYEVYRSKDAFIEHQKTPHYLAWREAVAPWMAAPRQGTRHLSVFPEDERDW